MLKMPHGYQTKLIDLDSGFLAQDPPRHDREMEGDPVYLAPDAFLRMAGKPSELTPKLDTFAFGMMIHRIWTGEFPAFDHERYSYLYEAVLDGGNIALSEQLPSAFHRTVRGMLAADPDARPSDARITALFERSVTFQENNENAVPRNGLSRLMKIGG